MIKKLLKKKNITIPLLIILILGIFFGYNSLTNKDGETRYLTAAVEKGTLIVSVSGSGQVSTLDQLDIKPKISGEVEAIYIQNGEEVRAGKLVIKLDDTDFQKAVRDAETSFETAKLELEELLSPPDELTLLQAENSLAQAKESKQKAEDNIEKAYEDAFNTIANALLDLPTIITGARDVLYSYEIAKSEASLSDYQWNESVYLNFFSGEDRLKLEPFIRSAEDDYKTARENYDQNFENYKDVSRYSEKEIIEELLNETTETTKSIAQAIKSEVNLLDYVVDGFSNRDWRVYSKIIEYQSDLKTYTGKTNSHLLSLLSIQRSLQDNREAIVNAQRTIEEKELSLAKLKAGPDNLDIRAKKITVQQKEDVLLAAKQDLADCYIYVPFDGIIAEIKIKKGDSVSTSTVLANIITQQKIAEISLNEIDVAKVKVGQKATLVFDALSDVSISGKVIEVDSVGTVTSGVVNYGVKITFDTQDERIKPSMSVTADIIIDAKQDVLVLPNSAIKSQGNSYYVELVEVTEEIGRQLLANVSGTILPKSPKLQPVEIGISNDLSIEVISGLKEGDIIVTSTISPDNIQTSQNQGFRFPGMGGSSGRSRGIR